MLIEISLSQFFSNYVYAFIVTIKISQVLVDKIVLKAVSDYLLIVPQQVKETETTEIETEREERREEKRRWITTMVRWIRDGEVRCRTFVICCSMWLFDGVSLLISCIC